MRREQITALAGAIIAACPIATALAQQAGFQLEEVVVTAQRREESLQKVAVSVTAATGAQLDEAGVRDISDLAKVAPQLTVQPGTFNNITQRGVSTGSFSPVNEGTTAVHIDGAYLARFTGLTGLMHDTTRVEINDGPQGTLFGRNAAAGTINIITNKPNTDSFGGRARIDVGSYNLRSIDAAVNMPLNDQFAARLAYYHSSHDGYLKSGLNDQNLDSARLSLLWKLNDRSNLTLTYGEATDTSKGTGGPIIDRVVKQPTVCVMSGGVAYIPTNGAGCATGETATPQTIVKSSGKWDDTVLVGNADLERDHTKNTYLILSYDYRFDFATLNISASRNTNKSRDEGGATLGYRHSPLLFTAGFQRLLTPAWTPAQSNWNSQEVRLTSNGEGTLKWMLGAYRYSEASKDSLGFPAQEACYPLTPAGAACTTGGSTYGQRVLRYNPDGSPVIGTVIDNARTTTDAYAGFGQATWTPAALDKLHLTLGLRYNTEDRYGKGALEVNSVPAFGGILTWDKSATFSDTTYKFNVAYDLGENSMVYIDRSKGFKSGGIGYGRYPVFEPEVIKSWEIGSKNIFFDGRLQVNASAWLYDWTNRVLHGTSYVYSANTPPTYRTGLPTTINVPLSDSKGQSVDIVFVPTRNDRVSLNLQHVKALYKDYSLTSFYNLTNQFHWCTSTTDGSTPTGGCVRPAGAPGAVDANGYINLVPEAGSEAVFNGMPVAQQAEWRANASYSHTFITGSGSQWEPTLSYRYSGTAKGTGLGNASLIDNPANGIFDFNLNYRPGKGDWSVRAYVRDINTVKVARTWASNNAGALLSDPNQLSQINYGYWTATYNPPRTYGLAVTSSF